VRNLTISKFLYFTESEYFRTVPIKVVLTGKNLVHFPRVSNKAS